MQTLLIMQISHTASAVQHIAPVCKLSGNSSGTLSKSDPLIKVGS